MRQAFTYLTLECMDNFHKTYQNYLSTGLEDSDDIFEIVGLKVKSQTFLEMHNYAYLVEAHRLVVSGLLSKTV